MNVIPSIVTAETGYVGIRLPSSEIAQKLISYAQTPICAPSANKFAHISPTSSVHVFNDLYDKELAILDGPSTNFGIESTVAKLIKDETTGTRGVFVLRHGSIPASKIRELVSRDERFSDVAVFEKDIEQTTSITKHAEAPGQLLKHYCPNITTYLLEMAADGGNSMEIENELVFDKDKTVIIDFNKSLKDLFSNPNKADWEVKKYLDLSPNGDIVEAMKNLYAYLREAEMVEGATAIYMVGKNRLL